MVPPNNVTVPCGTGGNPELSCAETSDTTGCFVCGAAPACPMSACQGKPMHTARTTDGTIYRPPGWVRCVRRTPRHRKPGRKGSFARQTLWLHKHPTNGPVEVEIRRRSEPC